MAPKARQGTRVAPVSSASLCRSSRRVMGSRVVIIRVRILGSSRRGNAEWGVSNDTTRGDKRHRAMTIFAASVAGSVSRRGKHDRFTRRPRARAGGNCGQVGLPGKLAGDVAGRPMYCLKPECTSSAFCCVKKILSSTRRSDDVTPNPVETRQSFGSSTRRNRPDQFATGSVNVLVTSRRFKLKEN